MCSPDLSRRMGFPLDIPLHWAPWWMGNTVNELSKNPYGCKKTPKISVCMQSLTLTQTRPFSQIFSAGVNGGYPNHKVVSLHY